MRQSDAPDGVIRIAFVRHLMPPTSPRESPNAWGRRRERAGSYLYCVDAESGDLRWTFRGGPTDHRLLGNERIINFWPARGGPVVADGKVYFAAGIWPQQGIFLHAINAECGAPVWVQDTVASDYRSVPRGRVYGGFVPQGYIAVAGGRLVVAGGRGPEAYFCRHTGEPVEVNPSAGHKGGGNYAVFGVDGGGRGMKINNTLKKRVEDLADRIGEEVSMETDRTGGGFADRHLRDSDDATNVFYKLAAHDRLIVVTDCGRLYCFGPEQTEKTVYEYSPGTLEPAGDGWRKKARRILEQQERSEGYALVLGIGSGDLATELMTGSDMHVVIVDGDESAVREMRDRLVETGQYGRRASVIQADPRDFSAQPYLFSIVASENLEEAGIGAEEAVMAKILDWLMPYTGTAWLGIPEGRAARLAKAADAAGVDRVEVEAGGDHLSARRGGPLTGAGEWTHQHHDAGNTLLSEDELVRLPVGVLWFGGPSNHDALPRHGRGPRPQVAGGRQVYLGVDTMSARCVYSGRRLWKKDLPGIGHPFTDLDLEARWSRGSEVYMPNLPGSSYIGSPYVTLRDGIYVRDGGAIRRLDPATGETLDDFALPGRSVEEIYGDEGAPEWGHISVQGDLLIVTSEPHIFEDQELGRGSSYSGTSSRRIAVMDRYSGETHWEREAAIGFRHNAIVSSGDRLYLIDGVSQEAVEHLARRGKEPEEPSRIFALELETGEEVWSVEGGVFGTFLIYSEEHGILVEGGSHDVRQKGRSDRALPDEPGRAVGRRAADGGVLWQSGLDLPAAVHGDRLIGASRHDQTARSLLTGERWLRKQPHTEEESRWNYRRSKNCDSVNASRHLLLFRTTSAGYFDLEHDTGTGFFSGFRSGCTASMIVADGVLNSLEYTRSCTCSYPQQTSLAFVHMPDDSNLEFWTRYAGAFRDPEGYGLNFGAPGRRVDVAGDRRTWHDASGTARRHPAAIESIGDGGLAWVAASVREGEGEVSVGDLPDAAYTVRLHFAELDDGVEAGDRVFDVYLDGEKVLEGFDIVGRTGAPLRGVVETFEVDVNGDLTVELRRAGDSQRDPVISGVDVTQL